MDRLAKKYWIGVALFHWLVFCSRIAFSQSSSINAIRNSLDGYYSNKLDEKIFVHTDRNFYLCGEIVWFKLYDVNANNQPFDISKIAYVEILNGENRPVLQAKIALTNGGGDGSFFLPAELSSGNYRLRAYTNWMKNFGTECFFEKTLTIVNAHQPAEPTPIDSMHAYDIHFFPEGGNLVSGIESRIAFLVRTHEGKGMNCKGIIIDGTADTVLQFQPRHFGMGDFSFMPIDGHAYKALIIDSSGNKRFYELPKIWKEGFSLRVNATAENLLNISIQNTGDKEAIAFLVIHSKQNIKIAETARLHDGLWNFSVPMEKLDDGISYITVFNSNQQPICERLVFKKPSRQLMLTALSDHSEYGTRKKINIQVMANDENKNARRANLSIAVFRLDSLQSIHDGEIVSYLWLTSELKGEIESPAYYFTNNGEEVNRDLDDLLLTRGWRRFDWDKLLLEKKSFFEFLPEYEGHMILGKVTDSRSGQPAKDILTYLSIPGKFPQFYCSRSDSNGNTRFLTKNFFGPGEIIVQTNPLEDSVYRVDIKNPFSDQYSTESLLPFYVSSLQEQLILKNSIAAQVQNLYSGNSFRKYANTFRDSSSFYGKADQTYMLDDYTRFTTMEEVLREYVSPVNVNKTAGKFHLNVVDDPRRALMKDDPLILLDGVPVFDVSQLMSYDPLKVKKLEVVSRKYYYGPLVNSGITSFTTYNGNLEEFHLDPRAIVLDYEGIQLEREFYSPKYETEQEFNSRLPDFRNLLYWAPQVFSNEKGMASIEFYSSDQGGKFLVVAQGITEDGRVGYTNTTFEIKK